MGTLFEITNEFQALYEFATTAELGDAIRQLEFANVKILGFVYNSAEGAKKSNYGKKYYSKYNKYGR